MTSRIKSVNAILHKFDVKKYDNMCHKCKDFDHLAKDCTSLVEVCGNCSGDHHTRDCTSQIYSCINCKRNNIAECNHSVYSSVCPVLKKHLTKR